jgi:hypothetical protein
MFAAIDRQPESPLLIDPEYNPREILSAGAEGAFAPLPDMAGLPFGLQSWKSERHMTLQVALQRVAQRKHEIIPIHHASSLSPYGGPWLVDSTIGREHVDVDAYAYDDMAHIRRITRQLQEDPSDLSAIGIYIVWPLQPRPFNAKKTQCLHDRQPHDQAHAR